MSDFCAASGCECFEKIRPGDGFSDLVDDVDLTGALAMCGYLLMGGHPVLAMASAAIFDEAQHYRAAIEDMLVESGYAPNASRLSTVQLLETAGTGLKNRRGEWREAWIRTAEEALAVAGYLDGFLRKHALLATWQECANLRSQGPAPSA